MACFKHPLRRFAGATLSILAISAGEQLSRGQQQYQIANPLPSGTVLIQNSSIPFNFSSEAGFGIDENFISFTQSYNADPNNGICLLNLKTGAKTHLVAVGEAVPGGATIAAFGTYSVAKGSESGGYFVLFSAVTTLGTGIYSVAGSGSVPPRIFTIADQSTAPPGFGTGTFGTNYDPYSVFEADDQHVVFAPSSPKAAFVAGLNGAGLTELAGSNTPVSVNPSCTNADVDYQQPRVFDGNAIFMGGTNSFDWSDPGLFLTPLTGIPLNTPTCPPPNNLFLLYGAAVNYQTVLPGVPPTIQYGGSNGNSLLAVDNKNIYFTDGTNAALFASPLSNPTAPVLLLGPTEQLPGMPPPPYNITSLAAEYGVVAFEAYTYFDGGTAAGIFSYSNGAFARIVETGDTVGGGTVGYGLYLNANAVSNGRIAMGLNTTGAGGIFLATPVTCAANVSADVQVTLGAVVPLGNNQDSQYVELKNISAQSIAGPVSIVLNSLNSTITLANTTGVGHTACTAYPPLGTPYLTATSAAIAPGAKVYVKLVFNNPNGLAVTYTTKVISGTDR